MTEVAMSRLDATKHVYTDQSAVAKADELVLPLAGNVSCHLHVVSYLLHRIAADSQTFLTAQLSFEGS